MGDLPFFNGRNYYKNHLILHPTTRALANQPSEIYSEIGYCISDFGNKETVLPAATTFRSFAPPSTFSTSLNNLNPTQHAQPAQQRSPSTMIKASRVAHLTDARYFAAREVDYLGFNLEEGTEGYLDPIHMKAIREWVQGPKIVGEFYKTPTRVVCEAAAFFGFEVVQVSAKHHGGGLADLGDLEIILAFEIGENGLSFSVEQIKNWAPLVDLFLFDFSKIRVTEAYFQENKDFWTPIFALKPSLLHADLPAPVWPGLLAEMGLAGISLTGGEEEQVGVKSFDDLEDIFDAVIGE